MGEIAERVYELKKAAIACGLEPDQAVDDVAEASGVAGQVTPDAEEDRDRADKWWAAFLRDYSVRCVGRWQAKCGYSRNYGAMERLWLEYFEPMWLAGCNYVKDLAIQNVRGRYDKIACKDTGRLSSEDLQKLKQYCNGVADDLEKVISSKIANFAILQRETLSRVIKQARQYYEGETVLNVIPVAAEDVPESEVSNAEILDEMCKMQSGFVVTRLAQGKGLSQAESNILQYKANPFRSGAFRVTETANEDEINKWLKHPMVNHPWPDGFVMSMAAQTPIPVKMMERLLRTLLQEDYESNWEKAEVQVRSKKSMS